MIIPQARIWLTMSTGRPAAEVLRRRASAFRTPSIGTAITGTAAAIIGGLFPVGILGELVSIGTLVGLHHVCLGVLVLRYTRPDLPRPFKVPWPWFTCIAGAAHLRPMMLFARRRHLEAPGGLDARSACSSTSSTAISTAGAHPQQRGPANPARSRLAPRRLGHAVDRGFLMRREDVLGREAAVQRDRRSRCRSRSTCRRRCR